MNRDCLNERDLTLLHYGEAPDGAAPAAAAAHLRNCPACRARMERLATDLSRLPPFADPDPLVATRIAARVNERLGRRAGRRWLPALGAATVATVVLAITFSVRSPQTDVEQITPPAPPSIVSLNLEEELPDLDFLEDLELIEELELLQQIEGA